MATKDSVGNRAEAQQVFRQFAWNLAGSLAKAKAKPTAPKTAQRSSRPAKKAGGK